MSEDGVRTKGERSLSELDFSGSVAEKLTTYLIRHGLTITFMESCTSGLCASMITDTEGASAVFKGSLVTYSNEAKIQAGVDKDVIARYGVYSKECALAMAKTAMKIFDTDISVGITGTTGNTDPANADSVTGEVFYCICKKEESYDYHLKLDVRQLSRQDIKRSYANSVFKSLLEVLKVRK